MCIIEKIGYIITEQRLNKMCMERRVMNKFNKKIKIKILYTKKAGYSELIL